MVCSQRRLRRHSARPARYNLCVAGRRRRRPAAELYPLDAAFDYRGLSHGNLGNPTCGSSNCLRCHMLRVRREETRKEPHSLRCALYHLAHQLGHSWLLGVLADGQHGACCERHLTNRSNCGAAPRVAGRGLLPAPPSAAQCSPWRIMCMSSGRRRRRPAAELHPVGGSVEQLIVPWLGLR